MLKTIIAKLTPAPARPNLNPRAIELIARQHGLSRTEAKRLVSRIYSQSPVQREAST